MQKINFVNLPSQTTPVNATNMNLLQDNVEDGILDVADAVYGNGYIDPNTTLYPLILTRNANAPDGTADFYYIQTMFYDGRTTTSSRKQIAYGFVTNKIYQRYYNNGWSNWDTINPISEGTWTPAINAVQETAPTVSYIFRKGHYKKIGNLVYISFYIRATITALNGTNNYACISGLPYPTSAGYYLGENPITLGVVYSAVNSDTNLNMNIYGDRIRITQTYGSASTKWIVTAGDYMEIGGSGWYETE